MYYLCFFFATFFHHFFVVHDHQSPLTVSIIHSCKTLIIYCTPSGLITIILPSSMIKTTLSHGQT